MSYTVAEYAQAIWEYVTRTTLAGTPTTPDGTYLDSVNHAVWEAASRTLTGSGATISCAGTPSAEASGSPAIGAGITTAGTATAAASGSPSIGAGITAAGTPTSAASGSPSIGASITCTGTASSEASGQPVIAALYTTAVTQVMPAPSQTITAEAIDVFITSVAESLPAPSQTITAEAHGGVKPKQGGGGFSYYPPIYAIRTKGNESAPAPRQSARLRTRQIAIGEQSAPTPRQIAKANHASRTVFSRIHSEGPAPLQSGQVWPHRLKHVREEEERKIILMLLGFEMEEYQAEAATVDD